MMSSIFLISLSSAMTNPIAYWNFETSQLGVSTIGNSNGVANGGITLSTTNKKVGVSAADFDGTTGYISVLDSGWTSPKNSMTVAGWFYTRSLGKNGNSIEGSFVSKGDSYILSPNPANNNVEFFVNFGGTNWLKVSSTPGSLTLNKWDHWAGTYDGNKINLYKNGIAVDNGGVSIVGIIRDSSSDLCIGKDCRVNNGFFDGLADDVRIYNRAVSVSDLFILSSGGIFSNDPETLLFDGRGGEEIYTMDSGLILSPTIQGDTRLHADISTEQRLCTLAGFTTVGTHSELPFSSPSDNGFTFWFTDWKWQTTKAEGNIYGNIGLTDLTCSGCPSCTITLSSISPPPVLQSTGVVPTPIVPHKCSLGPSDVILRIEKPTNALGEVYNGANNYIIEICFSELFPGKVARPVNPNPSLSLRQCMPGFTNRIVQLNDATKAKATR